MNEIEIEIGKWKKLNARHVKFIKEKKKEIDQREKWIMQNNEKIDMLIREMKKFKSKID